MISGLGLFCGSASILILAATFVLAMHGFVVFV